MCSVFEKGKTDDMAHHKKKKKKNNCINILLDLFSGCTDCNFFNLFDFVILKCVTVFKNAEKIIYSIIIKK